MTTSEQPGPERPRPPRSGDARLSDDDREILRRLTSGDLVDEFADALAKDVADDDLLG